MTNDNDQRVIKGVMLNAREQEALAWLLHATNNGGVISGNKLPDVMHLKSVQSRLGRTRNAKKC